MHLPDSIMLLQLKCRNSRHAFVRRCLTSLTAEGVLQVLQDYFEDDPLFTPQLIVTDDDVRHTPALIAAVKTILKCVMYVCTPNRHSNGSAEGQNSVLRPWIAKRCLEYGGWSSFRPHIDAELRRYEQLQAETPNKHLSDPGWHLTSGWHSHGTASIMT